MSKNWMGVFFLLSLSGCATPSTILVNDQGQIMRCAASGWGWIGTPHALLIHQKCVDDLKSIGYVERVPGAPQLKRSVPIVMAAGSLNSSTVDRYDSVVVIASDAPGAPGSGAALEGLVTTSMLNFGFAVVERTKIQNVFDEQQFQLQHADETTRGVSIGKLAGAKAVVIGSIHEWKQEKINEQSRSSVSLGLKIIDVETAAVVFNGHGSYSAPLRDSPQVISQLLLGNIMAHFAANIGLRGFLGIAWKLTEEDGRQVMVITTVLPGTPADESGLKQGDVVLTCNGKSGLNWKNHRQSLRECRTEPGQEMVFQIKRAGEALILKMTAVDRVQWMKDKTTAK